MQFFLGRSEREEKDSDSDSEADTQTAGETRTLKEVMVGFKAGKKTKKRKKAMEKARNAIKKESKGKKAKVNDRACNILAIRHLYDPQEFAERLQKQLEKSTER